MSKSVLSQIQLELKKHQEENIKQIQNLEQKPEVKKYIQALETRRRLKENEQQLLVYEEGYDGTIFSQDAEIIDQSCNKKFYGLSDMVARIIELKALHNLALTTDFTEIKNYAKQASKILNDMKYYDGDLLEQEYLGLEIYENPKSYKFANFSELEKNLSMNQWNASYKASQYIVYNDNNKTFSLFRPYPSIVFSELINDRQYQAFYGSDAYQVLGIDTLSSKLTKDLVKGAK